MNLRELPIIDGEEVARLAPYADVVDAMAAAHRERPAQSRRVVFGPDGSHDVFLALPAWREAIGIKLVTVFPANPAAGRPSVQALYVLFDGSTGEPVALIDGTELTYRKTAADSALGARFLARDDAATMLMIGAGGLAPHLIAAHRAVRPSLERVLVWNRTRAKAEAVAAGTGVVATVVDSLAEAVAEADVISTATMTAEPLVEGRWLRPGTHLDLVGAFQPDHREVDDDAVAHAQLYVDDRGATLTECGDLVIPLRAGLITAEDVRGDLYELCRGDVPGRTDPDVITLFENGGGGHLDLMTAQFLWRRYSSEGLVPSEGLVRESPAANPPVT